MYLDVPVLLFMLTLNYKFMGVKNQVFVSLDRSRAFFGEGCWPIIGLFE
jgi:hypothetical protein